MINQLRLTFDRSPESNDHQVRFLVDGADILARSAGGPYVGIDPPEFFQQRSLAEGGRGPYW